MAQGTKKKQGKVETPSPAKNKLNLYLFHGNGIVWDRARDKALCRFEKGKLLTNDIRTIAILVKKRYKYKAKHSIAKDILDEAYNSYKKEIKANEKQSRDQLTKTLDRLKTYDRKKLNNMRIPELKVLIKAKKIRLLPFMTKQEMINRLLGARR